MVRPIARPFLLVALCSALLASNARAESATPFAVETVKDVRYYDEKDADPVRHRLDLYLPKGEKEFPVVLFVHGGGWMMGDKNFLGLHAAFGRFLAAHGIGAVLPNYRLSPGVRHPEHVRDVARAFAWTHKNIGKHGGRSDRLLVAGHSAGGHLAALLATDGSHLKDEGLTLDAIRGVICLSGVYNIPERDADLIDAVTKDNKRPGRGDLGPSIGNGFLTLLSPYTPAFGTDAAVRRAASPLTHVSAGLPPFLIFTADNDFPTLPEMADEFARALRKSRCEVTLTRAKDRSHNSLLFKATADEDPVGRDILAFIHKHAVPRR